LDVGERVTILAPTLFFGLSLIWALLFQGHLKRDLESLYHKERKAKWGEPTGFHFFQVFFADALFLFIINGLILILELKLPLEGVIQLLIGFTFAATGLITSFMGKEKRYFTVSDFIFTISIAGGQFGFLGTVETTTGITANPWVVFGSGFIVTMILIFGVAGAAMYYSERQMRKTKQEKATT